MKQPHIMSNKPHCPIAVVNPVGRRSAGSPPSPVLKMRQPVSSAKSPGFITTPTGRSSLFAASKSAFSTPVFSLASNVGVGEKASDAFSLKLREVSPTSVASLLPMEGIARGPPISGGIASIKLNYDHRSPSSEMVFEPASRESSRRVPMFCSPCRNIHEDDTSDVTSPSPSAAAAAAVGSSRSASLLKLRSSNRSSNGRSRASDMSPTSPTPQNLKDNPERLAKVKTEMCRYFELGGLKNCPWGDKCKCKRSLTHEIHVVYHYSSLHTYHFCFTRTNTYQVTTHTASMSSNSTTPPYHSWKDQGKSPTPRPISLAHA